MINTTRSFLLASAAVAALAPGLARAQTAPVTTLQEVVVTARKTSERIQDVPLAITSYSAKDLASRGVVGLKDIAQFTPGFVFQEYSSTFDSSPTFRGLTQFDVTSSVANVSTVVNGVYVPRNYSVDLGIADVSRIEVIKGPQSALYGGNAFAGVIAYTLAQPTSSPHADFSVTGGTAGRADVKVDASAPMFNDLLELRGYYASSVYDGTWKNNYPGASQNVGGHDNRTYGLSAKFKPTDKIEADVNLFHLDRHEDIKPSFNVLSTDPQNKFNCVSLICGPISANPGSYQSSSSTRPAGIIQPYQPGFTSSTDFLSAQLKVELARNFDVTYLFGHVRSYATEITSSSDNPISGSTLYYPSIFNHTFTDGPYTNDQKEGGINTLNSHELRFDYSIGHLKALVGFYYSSDTDIYQFNIWQVANGQGITGGDPTSPTDFSAFPFELIGHHLVTDSTAEFGRLAYGFLDDRLTVAAEVRHSSDALTYQDLVAHLTQKATFGTTTPRFTVDYKLTPSSLLYASAAQGVKQGGFNGLTGASGLFNLLPSQQTFQPESNWTYEVGTKNTFFGGRALINADLFLVKWQDLQIQEQPSNTPPALGSVTAVITTNLGAATSYGLETNGLFAVTRHLDLTYAASVINPTFDKGTKSARFAGYCNGVICPTNLSVAGNVLPRTSKDQVAAGATWKDTIVGGKYQWNIHGDFTYQSEQQAEEMNVAQIPARLLVNASAGIKGDKWDLTIWGKNIFNQKYVADSFFILNNGAGYGVSLGELATMGVTLNLHY